MKRKISVWINLLLGIVVFSVFFYGVFGASCLYLQKRNIEETQSYVKYRLKQLQLNLEATETIYETLFGKNTPQKEIITNLIQESNQIQNQQDLVAFTDQIKQLNQYVTYAEGANQVQQRALRFVLYVNNKLLKGLLDLQEKTLLYEGSSRIFPGLRFVFPLQMTGPLTL